MRRLTLTLLGILFATPALAQTPVTPLSTMAWDQAAPTLTAAQSYIYGLYIGTAPRADLPTVTCTGTASPYRCTAPVPAMTPGPHTLQLTASQLVAGVRGESAKTPPLAIVMVIAPAAPSNFTLQ